MHTDPLASPTGFPFKVFDLQGTLSDEETYEHRIRICDLGYLRQVYRKEDGTASYRCPAEPEEDFLAKGGKLEDTHHRKCVCNGLFSTIGYAQVRKDGMQEPALITAGDDIVNIGRFVGEGQTSYHASDVIKYLLSESVKR